MWLSWPKTKISVQSDWLWSTGRGGVNYKYYAVSICVSGTVIAAFAALCGCPSLIKTRGKAFLLNLLSAFLQMVTFVVIVGWVWSILWGMNMVTMASKCFMSVSYMRGPSGGRGSGPPEKSQKYKVSLQFWSRSPERSRSYRASIQCWTIISTPAKRHLNGVLLAGRWWLAYSGIWILPPLIK